MTQPSLDDIFSGNSQSTANASRPSLDQIFGAPSAQPSLDDIFSGKPAAPAPVGGLQGMLNQAGSFAKKLIPAAVTAGKEAGLSTTPSPAAFNADMTNPQAAPGGAVGATVNAIGQGATKMVTEAGQGIQQGAQQILQAGGSNEIGGAVSGVNEQGQQMSPTDRINATGQGAADVVTGTLKSLLAIPGAIGNAVPGGQQVMGALNDKISQGSTAVGNAFMAITGIDPNSEQGKILSQHFQNLGQLLTVEATEKAAPVVSDLVSKGVEAVKKAVAPGAGGPPGGAPPGAGAAPVNPVEEAATKAATAKSNVDQAIQEGIQKGIKPSVVSQRIPNYVDKVTNAVVDTVRNKENLTVTKPTGEVTEGSNINFKDLGAKQAQQIVEQTKADVFQKYNDLAKQSGEKGLTISNDNVAQELRSLTDNKALQIAAPKVVEYAQKLANRLDLHGDMTPLEQQGVIQQFNGKMNDFYNKRGSAGSATAEVNAMALNLMRKNLDEGISSATDPGYQDLKNSYGNLETLRKDLEHRAAITGNKATVGLLQHMGNLTSAVELGKSILTGNVPGMLTGAAVKGITEWVKRANSPDTAIGKMFSRVEDNVGDLPAKAPAVNTRLQLPEGRAPGASVNTPINLPEKMPLDQGAVDAANAEKLKQPGGFNEVATPNAPVNRNGEIPKELQPLVKEAQEYKSPEEFVAAQKDKMAEKFNNSDSTISEIQSLRHDLHSLDPDSVYNSNSSDYGKMDNYIDTIADNIESLDITGREKGIASEIRKYSNSEGGNRPSDTDLEFDDHYQKLLEEDDPEEINNYNDSYSTDSYRAIANEKEQINNIVETYLKSLDEKYQGYDFDSSDENAKINDLDSLSRNGTFAPSGFARARSILGEGLNNTARDATYQRGGELQTLTNLWNKVRK
jgi:hypothetical protein